MSTTPVSDDVWNHLDRDAARPSRRTRRVIAAVAAVATFFAVVVAFGFISGMFRPGLWVETSATTHFDRSTHAFTYSFRIHNPDWIDEKLTAITSTDPNITMQLSHSFTFAQHDSAYLTVRTRVLDCARVHQGEPFLELHVDRVWGELSETHQVDPLDPVRSPGNPSTNEAVFMTGAPYFACHGAVS